MKWLNEQGWPTTHKKFLSLIKVDEHENSAVTSDLMKRLDQLPWVGPTLAAYIAKNLGVGSSKDDDWMLRLAGWLGYFPDMAGVWKMAWDV